MSEATTRAALSHLAILLDVMRETDTIHEPDDAELARKAAQRFLDIHRADLEAYENDLAAAEARAGELIETLKEIQAIINKEVGEDDDDA